MAYDLIDFGGKRETEREGERKPCNKIDPTPGEGIALTTKSEDCKNDFTCLSCRVPLPLLLFLSGVRHPLPSEKCGQTSEDVDSHAIGTTGFRDGYKVARERERSGE